jgi:hypothetical protein
MSTSKALAIAFGIAAIAGVGALSVAFTVGWYPNWCHACPGATPLGAVLAVGNGSANCPAGSGSSLADCAYAFSLRVYSPAEPSPPVSARNLAFELHDANGWSVGGHYAVTLTTQMGCPVGTWDSLNSTWTALTGSNGCPAPYSIASPLETGGSFLVRSVPNGGLPYSGADDQLVAVGTGDGLSGQVLAPFP